MTTETEWLDYTTILGGKIVAEIEKWSNAFDAGKISKREYLIAIGTLYDATSGIAPRDVSETLAAIYEGVRQA